MIDLPIGGDVMVTVPKKQEHGQKLDPDARQLRRDRLTVLAILVILVIIIGGIVALAAGSGMPSGSDMMEPWMMM
jgi:hypothetical protein